MSRAVQEGCIASCVRCSLLPDRTHIRISFVVPPSLSLFLAIKSIYIWLISYSPFSDRVGLPHHNIPSPGVLMKNIEAEFL